MRIVILGAGFAGLATAWHLINKNPTATTTIIDQSGVGAGASGVSAGLLHPYTGVKAKQNWCGLEGMESSIRLLEVASSALGEPVFKQKGLLRQAAHADQEEAFKLSAQNHTDVNWLTGDECQNLVPGVSSKPGIFIPNACSVYPEKYMQGLALACKNLGIVFDNRKVNTLNDVDEFDLVIATLGAGTFEIPELSQIRHTKLKGQILELPWPESLPPLKHSISSQVYLVMSADNKSCFVGSTFERDYDSDSPEMEYASQVILPKLYRLYPQLEGIQPIDCRAGVRVNMPNRLPLIKQISEKCWVFTGLGSKGLLYHSLMAENLVAQI